MTEDRIELLAVVVSGPQGFSGRGFYPDCIGAEEVLAGLNKPADNLQLDSAITNSGYQLGFIEEGKNDSSPIRWARDD